MEPIPYRFYITGRSGTREAFPKNGNALAIKWQSENENAYLRKQLTGKIIFINEDFDFLYYLEKGIYRCEAVDLRIDSFCQGNYQPFISSKIIFTKGFWDEDSRSVEIEPTILDLYTCFDDNSDVDYNLFNYVSGRFTVSSLQGEIQTVKCNTTDGSPWCQNNDPYSQGYIIVSQSVQYGPNQTPNGPGQPGGLPAGGGFYQTTWVREVKSFSIAPPAPWVNIGGDMYARPPILFNYQYTNNEDGYYFTYQYGATFDNGLNLKSIFQTFINLSCYGYIIKSNFFQWNPDNETDINYVTGQPSKVLNLLLFQKSDIKRPSVDNNATIASISFSDLLKDICNIFNLKWWIDENNNFNIEHISFNNRIVGMNAITRYDSQLRAGTNSYSYDNDNLPRKEVFSWMDAVYGEFAGTPIFYNNACAGLGNSNSNDISISNITTDMEFLLQNPNSDSNSASDDGFCLVACDTEGNIISEAPILTGNTLNNSLSWSRLHVDYWRYGRPFHQFLMNGQQTLAESVKATKKQSGLIFKLCCGDHFNPDELITTKLGNGQVDNPTYKIYKNELTLDLLYEADINLSDNAAPVAVNDDAITFVNLPIIIDVLANDTDSDGIIANQTLAILLNPSNGIAEITPDFKIKYTPNSGFSGNDSIVYRVSDNLQEPSNNGIVNITIKPGSPLPIANSDNYIVVKNKPLSVSANGVLSNDTGDGNLSVIAESKATNAGGTVIIYANGSFVYTPANNYLGNDTFSYTIKDSNDNEAVGNVNITVFEAQPVYVKMVHSNQRTTDIIEDCREPGQGGLPVGGLGQNTKVGEQTLEDITLYFYSDNQGYNPLNVTGYDLKVKVKLTQAQNEDAPVISHIQYDVDGVMKVIERNFLTNYIYNGCDFDQNNRNTPSLELETSSDYQII